MEDEIKLLNTKLDYFDKNLRSAKSKIETQNQKLKILQYQLTSEKAVPQSGLVQDQTETTKKERDLTTKKQNICNSLERTSNTSKEGHENCRKALIGIM